MNPTTSDHIDDRVAPPIKDDTLRKRETPEYLLPSGIKVQVEAMGLGQQVVAFGIHPETMQPYRWLDATPENTRLSDLPLVSEKALTDFLRAVELLFRDSGVRTEAEFKSAEARPQETTGQSRTSAKSNGAASGDTFFSKVNALALANLVAWVRRLFPRAVLQQTGAYRIASKDLGRDYEEDLSIHPDGIRDFGPRKGLSAIDVVMEFGGAATLQNAWR